MGENQRPRAGLGRTGGLAAGPRFAPAPSGPEALLAEERLAFTDRIIGLEQQVRELQAPSRLSPSETVAVEANLANMKASLTWRAGRVVTLPVRVLRYVKRRFLG